MMLLIVFSFPLIPAAVFAHAPGSNLPACCRKDGKHGCSMKGMTVHEGSASQVAIKSAPRCDSFPKAAPFAPVPNAFMPAATSPAIPLTLQPLSAVEHAEAYWRVSFSRAWQKRGPPASPLS
jgi:hypothetical protein